MFYFKPRSLKGSERAIFPDPFKRSRIRQDPFLDLQLWIIPYVLCSIIRQVKEHILLQDKPGNTISPQMTADEFFQHRASGQYQCLSNQCTHHFINRESKLKSLNHIINTGTRYHWTSLLENEELVEDRI
jgi:hypothetical protein